MQTLQPLPASWRDAALRISIIHRLAVLLNRSRSRRELHRIRFAIAGETINLVCADGWLAANPLTAADFSREKNYLANIEFELNFV